MKILFQTEAQGIGGMAYKKTQKYFDFAIEIRALFIWIWSRVPETWVTFSLFLCKIQPAVYFTIAKRYRGARQLGWASWVASAGRVTPASATPFVQRNTFGLSINQDNSRRGECQVLLSSVRI